MKRASLSSVKIAGKRALVRADLNVPLDDKGEVTDALRIEESLHTIRHVVENGGSVVMMSHLGRPKGPGDKKLMMNAVASVMEKKLGRKVRKLDGCVEPAIAAATKKLKPGDVVLLENVRFYAEEQAGNEEFARKLAVHGDFFVGDAFGTVHRPDASVAVVPRFLKPAVAGILLEKELVAFEKIIEKPDKPFLVVLGGAKVSDKIPVIENLIGKADEILIGGGMAYTFLKVKGQKIGSSLVDEKNIATAERILKAAEAKGVKIVLPVDHVVADSLDAAAGAVIKGGFDRGMGLDIGPDTRELFRKRILSARTIVWNGPMGVFEKKPFSAGSLAVANAMADSDAFTVIGGGDTAAAVAEFGVESKLSHISTGGGASLELLSGKALPGVEALDPA